MIIFREMVTTVIGVGSEITIAYVHNYGVLDEQFGC